MKIELITFKNTIARNVFLLFILSAFVPVSLFTYFSILQVDKVTTENTQKQLQNDAKGYSFVLHERLLARNYVMKQLAHELLNPDASKWQSDNIHTNWFESLVLLDDNALKTIYWGDPPTFTLTDLSSDSRHFLQEGKTLLRIITDSNTKKLEILMLRQISSDKNSGTLLIGVINQNELWGSEDSFDLRKSLCVINYDNAVLFCSNPDIKNTVISMTSQGDFQSRGKVTWSENNAETYAGYSSLFLRYNFFHKDWMIFFLQEKSEVFYGKGFSTIFYIIIAITLVVVVYISLINIRQQMKPLDALMQGISRITRNNFTKPVPVLGDNEFGQLAVEFNRMSDRLRTQLNILTTLADIDQLILSRLTISDIIKMVLTRANEFIKSDSVSVTLLTKDCASQAIMYTAEDQKANSIAEQAYTISIETLQEIYKKRFLYIDQSHKQWHDSIQPLNKRIFHNYLIIPIGYKEDTIAFLTFAYQQQSTLSTDMIKWGQEFSDRIAVALANASWEKQLYQQAHYDSLTDLPNRLLFQDRLQQAIDQADRGSPTPVVLFLDLDNFKNINDSLGHMVGDNLLRQIAKRINVCLRKSDTVARIGGDEFVLLLEGFSEPTSFDLVTPIKKILNEITQPLSLEGNEIRITASIGVAIYPHDGDNVEILLKNSDTALYEAKKQGKARYHFYSEELNATMLNTLLLESDLHKALDNNEFQLYFQAQVETKTGLILGTEVLLRWIHPEKGLISPFVFIPLIEQSGLIIPIGHWVIQEACRQNKEWQLKGLPKIRIAINLSTKQFTHKTLYADIKRVLEESQLETKYIEIEITEGTAMDNFNASGEIMKDIRNLGIEISIDDYGTGYSSLEYIKDFPVDTLKIDRKFIINLVQSNKEQAIVRSTIAMAHDLGLKVIAEGVEDEAQYKVLDKMGCDQIQGYYFSKPIPAKKFEILLAKGAIKP